MRQDPLESWRANGFRSPARHPIKMMVLDRYCLDDLWIETGTFLGDTTAYLASKYSMVYTIEPSHELAERAKNRFSNSENIEVISGTSEDMLPKLVIELIESRHQSINFWLDGHYSAGITYQGDADTPIIAELAAVEIAIQAKASVAIFIDDVRCFVGISAEYNSYPPLSTLTKWAERHNLRWTIEHDILVIFSPNEIEMVNQEIRKQGKA